MSYTQKAIVYFDRPGPQNTNEVLGLARERAEELNIRDVVVASTRGETGLELLKSLEASMLLSYLMSQVLGRLEYRK